MGAARAAQAEGQGRVVELKGVLAGGIRYCAAERQVKLQFRLVHFACSNVG